jgi:hypothetical protein
MLQITKTIFIIGRSRIRFSSKRPAILAVSHDLFLVLGGIRGRVLHVLSLQSFVIVVLFIVLEFEIIQLRQQSSNALTL